jgi:hypothetical protein
MVGTDFEPEGANGANPREFTGIIDEVAILKIVLSDENIQQAMKDVMGVELIEKLAISWGLIPVKIFLAFYSFLCYNMSHETIVI